MFLHNQFQQSVSFASIAKYCCLSLDRFETGVRTAIVFSLSGIVYLSTIAYMLQHDSLYIKIPDDVKFTKQELAKGVLGAIVLYILCFLISMFVWMRTPDTFSRGLPLKSESAVNSYEDDFEQSFKGVGRSRSVELSNVSISTNIHRDDI